MTAAIAPQNNGAANGVKPEPVDNGKDNGVENAKEKGIFAQFMKDPSVMPATVAQQIFSVVPGIAGGLAGFILAGRLAKARKVKTKGVLIAALANAALTMLTIFLIVESDEIEAVKEADDEDEEEEEE